MKKSKKSKKPEVAFDIETASLASSEPVDEARVQFLEELMVQDWPESRMIAQMGRAFDMQKVEVLKMRDLVLKRWENSAVVTGGPAMNRVPQIKQIKDLLNLLLYETVDTVVDGVVQKVRQKITDVKRLNVQEIQKLLTLQAKITGTSKAQASEKKRRGYLNAPEDVDDYLHLKGPEE